MRFASTEVQARNLTRVRPSRLGVGASVPASTGAVGHEAVKLRNKLAGKKRQREEDPIVISSQSEAEEEESRAGAIKKKARIDPFAQKGKKKAVKATATPVASSSKKPLDAARMDIPDPEKTPPPRTSGSADLAASPPQATVPASPGKKKRKKKKKKHAAPLSPALLLPTLGEMLDIKVTPEPAEVIVIDDTPPQSPSIYTPSSATYQCSRFLFDP